MSHGIKETKEMLKFMIELGEGLDKSLEDKKLSYSDAFNFAGVLIGMPAAFEGADKIPAELKDLDEVEKAELVKYVEQELDLKSDKTEHLIEAAIKLAGDITSYVKMFKKNG